MDHSGSHLERHHAVVPAHCSVRVTAGTGPLGQHRLHQARGQRAVGGRGDRQSIVKTAAQHVTWRRGMLL